MSSEREEQEQVAIRLPLSWLQELDEFAEHMSTPATRVTRTQALREVIYRGIEQYRKETRKR